jgi:hypothetical protein
MVNISATSDSGNPVQLAIDKAGGLTAFATALGVSRQTAHNWRLRKRPPVQYVLQIEGRFGISRELLCGEWASIWPPERRATDRAPRRSKSTQQVGG